VDHLGGLVGLVMVGIDLQRERTVAVFVEVPCGF
jgi:hypothetical protein